MIYNGLPTVTILSTSVSSQIVCWVVDAEMRVEEDSWWGSDMLTADCWRGAEFVYGEWVVGDDEREE